MWGSCEEAIAVVRDADQQVLAAMVLLEDKIERLSHSLSCGHWQLWSHRHSGSHWCRLRTGSCPNKAPPGSIMPRGIHQEVSPVPSPMWLRWWVTFEDNPGGETRAGEPCPLTWEDDEGTGEPSDWSRPEARPDEEDLGCPPALNPLVQEFLSGGDAPWARDRMKDNPWQTSMPEPSPQSTNELIGWCTKQVNMPAWWQELWEVLDQSDPQEFARRVRASFQVPKASCHATKVENDYPSPQVPHSLDRDCLVLRPGLLAEAATEDFGLCKGPPVLGGKCQATNPRWTLPTGRKCARALMWDGAPNDIYG